MSFWDDLFTVQGPTDEYSDNPPYDSYDPYPDTSLGAEGLAQEELGRGIVQETLGQQIVEETQRGLYQEELGRGIVQETLGRSILDDLLRFPDTTQPWFKGVDGSLSGVARVMSTIPGLLGDADPAPTPGGIPQQLGTQPYFGPTGRGRTVSLFPTNTTRDGRSGTLTGVSVRPAASLTGEFGGVDFLYAGLALVVAYGAFRVVRAL
jgi:hypothetical protein